MPDTFPPFTLPFLEWGNRDIVCLFQEARLLGGEKDIPILPPPILGYEGKGKLMKNLDEERGERER